MNLLNQINNLKFLKFKQHYNFVVLPKIALSEDNKPIWGTCPSD